MASADGTQDRTLAGRLFAASGRSQIEDVPVWLAYRPVDGAPGTMEALSNADGRFQFQLPSDPMAAARLGASVAGVSPVDLEPSGSPLEPGDIVLVIEDGPPAHLRYADGG